MTIDRVHAARAVADELGADLLVLTPGSDLRYLCGYAAHAMERLTALVVPARGEPFLVVPRLEAPMVDAELTGHRAGGVHPVEGHQRCGGRCGGHVGRLTRAPDRTGVRSRLVTGSARYRLGHSTVGTWSTSASEEIT